MSLAVRQPPRRFYTAFFSYKRRFVAPILSPARSSLLANNEDILSALERYGGSNGTTAKLELASDE